MKSNLSYFEKRNIFPKHYRLLSKSDFKLTDSRYIYENPIKLVYCARGSGRTNSRLGIVVTKKFSKRAVERNKIKRLLRENFRTSSLVSKGLDVVAIVSKPLPSSQNGQLGSLIFKSFNKIEGRLLWARTKKEH